MESAKLGSLALPLSHTAVPTEELGSPSAQPHPLRRSLVGLLDISDPHRKQRT